MNHDGFKTKLKIDRNRERTCEHCWPLPGSMVRIKPNLGYFLLRFPLTMIADFIYDGNKDYCITGLANVIFCALKIR